jgi:hypothetical protein
MQGETIPGRYPVAQKAWSRLRAMQQFRAFAGVPAGKTPETGRTDVQQRSGSASFTAAIQQSDACLRAGLG